MKFGLSLFTAVALAALPTVASAETTLRLAHMNSPTHFVNVESLAMAKAVKERTKGEVNIEVYPSGQLGENGQVTEQISLGGALIGQVGVGTLADFVPDYSVIVYPFLYPDYETARKFLKTDLVKSWEKKVEKNNIKVLCYLAFGVRDLYTRDKIVKTPADSAGLKIRVQPVTIYTEMVKTVMGGSPTPMPWPDVYSALSQGVIDAAEAPPSAVLDQKHYEVTKYFMQTNHILDLSPLIMSASAFNAMTPENQAIVEDEAGKACDRMSDSAMSGYKEGVEELRSKGMTIVSDVDRAAFAAKAAGVAKAFPEWTPGLYDTVKKTIDGLK
jgi:tripartite ATP-independent transporter DctP family solute receptor